MDILQETAAQTVWGRSLSPVIGRSEKYKHWVSEDDIRRCAACKLLHGKIWQVVETPDPEPPLHGYCRCMIEPMQTIQAGTATIEGTRGADWVLKQTGKLPGNYISENDAEAKGFQQRLGNLAVIAPGKLLTKGVYLNRNAHLPVAPGRIWYEADINYVSGYRGAARILYSNDGLMFTTYDHYKTFYEIV